MDPATLSINMTRRGHARCDAVRPLGAPAPGGRYWRGKLALDEKGGLLDHFSSKANDAIRYNGRVEVCLAAYPPHRTVLAQLTHTAPQGILYAMYADGHRMSMIFTYILGLGNGNFSRNLLNFSPSKLFLWLYVSRCSRQKETPHKNPYISNTFSGSGVLCSNSLCLSTLKPAAAYGDLDRLRELLPALIKPEKGLEYSSTNSC
ncbi:hypothetical protein MOTHE_c22970 [Moorella thermoacetica]|nr:hypothetical protein MOTHE_c22970 [Moorella thermoacetica]AKX97706.1 hypothetical protein MOTHA_c23700 [Moorella thermoacetica]OIQ52856.1 hypothetical protein MOCA_26180 [Moorella thermoacetica]QDA01526.1 hypothetical protein MothHH_02414 [Moorella thermoacetica]TYL06529.1 hypothetical protein MOLA_26540 [Moorella thermoacetica]